MSFLSDARSMYLNAAKNLAALDAGRMNVLDGVAKHLPGGRRTKLKTGFNAIAESFAICIAPTADVLIGNSETDVLVIEVEGCDWMTLESDIRIGDAAELLVLEAELFADFPVTADVFLRVFDQDGNSSDLGSDIWTVQADGLSVQMKPVPAEAKTASRARLILHLRQPIGPIRIRQLGVYIL